MNQSISDADAEGATGPDNDFGISGIANRTRVDSDYVFHELTRSICPSCKTVIDAKILLRDNKVYMSKRCSNCGPFMALVYEDARAYVSFARFNKPGTIPRAYGAAVERGYNVQQWTEMPRGGHFAAMEEPELLAADIRSFFRRFRR